MASTDLYGIRDYLKNQGYKDTDIDYNNGTVTLQGRSFINATPEGQDNAELGLRKDSTYASGSALANALKNYQSSGLSSGINQVNSALTNRINQPAATFSAPKPFTYDMNNDQAYQSALQSALANAKTASNNAQVSLGSRGIGNSSIATDRANQIQQNAVGQVTRDVLPNLIQQAYQRYVNQNADERQAQLDTLGQQQQGISNLFNLGNSLQGQQQSAFNQGVTEAGLTGQYNGNNTLAQRQANLNAALQVGQQTGNLTQPVDDWRNLFLQGNNLGRNLTGQQYDANQQNELFNRALQEAGLTGTYNGEPTLAARNQAFNQGIEQQRLGLSAAGQGQSASNARINQLLDIYRATGQAPSGLESYGVQPGTSYYNPSNPQNAPKPDAKQSANYYSQLTSAFGKQQGLTREQAIATLNDNVDVFTDADYKRAVDWIDKNLD